MILVSNRLFLPDESDKLHSTNTSFQIAFNFVKNSIGNNNILTTLKAYKEELRKINS